MKIITIVGARPQFIKAAMFSKELTKQGIEEVMIHTGQHYDENMSKSFFEEFGLQKEKYNLDINQGTHAEQTGNMLIKIEQILTKEKPDFVVVFGDTNSTLAGALASAKEKYPLIHIEAGFRSYDKTMPEEVNRVLSDHLADFLFCVNDECVDCLKKEGITKNVFISGDLMYEALQHFSKKDSKILLTLELKQNKYVYVTVHRQGNVTKEHLEQILKGLSELKIEVVFALHPRTRNELKRTELYNKYSKIITFINPVQFHDSITLAKNAKAIITDSGGLLKEAYYLQKPCIILRENVEFKTIIDVKAGVLVGANSKKIIDAYNTFTFNTSYNIQENKKVAQKIINELK